MLDKLNLRAGPVYQVLRNDPARNPKFLNTLRGLRVPDRFPETNPGQIPLNGHRRNGASRVWGNHPVAVYPLHHGLVGFCGQESQVDIKDVAVPYRAVIGDHTVADNRRGPVIVDNGGPVDIRDPDTGVAVHAVEAAPGDDNRMAGVSQPADADAASSCSNNEAPWPPILI